MSIVFDGTGYIQLQSDWTPTNLNNFEVEVELTLSSIESQRFVNSSNNRNTFRLFGTRLYFGWEGVSSSVKFTYLDAANPEEGVLTKLKAKVVSSTSIEVYKDDALADTVSPADFPIQDWFISTIGSESNQPMVAGSSIHSLKLTDLETPANSSVYLFDQASGTTLVDSGPLGNDGALTAFADPNSAWTAQATPTITNINTTNEFTPGEANTLNGENLSETGGSIVIDGETQTITNRTATAITFTGVRGGNPYNTDLTLTYTDADSNEVTQTVQQVPADGFAVTAASPNTTDDASLWTGLVDTSTGDPVMVVDGDQALVKSGPAGFAVDPDGRISADETGPLTVQFWRASEGAWGSDQTVTFEVPDTGDWPFGKAINPIATKNWTWGGRHPTTQARVRMFKGNS